MNLIISYLFRKVFLNCFEIMIFDNQSTFDGLIIAVLKAEMQEKSGFEDVNI